MSHPLMVEAIEDLFIPLLVYNNKESDVAVLKSFDEPSWNNPVVRFLDSDGRDVIPRADGVWTTAGIVDRVQLALKQAGRPVPPFIRLVEEKKTKSVQTAEFAMHCYWEGEAKLGSIKGVMATRSGWRQKLEVVELTYDESIVDYASLLDAAKRFECTSKIFTRTPKQQAVAEKLVGEDAIIVPNAMRDAKESDQKYYLRQTTAVHLPLTELQATKINAALGAKKPWRQMLSPRQTKRLEQIDQLVASNKKALANFSYPTDGKDLVEYSRRFNIELSRLNSLSTSN